MPVRRTVFIAAASLLVSLLLSVPALAGGGGNKVYVGEINQPPLDRFSPHPKVELFVHAGRNGAITIPAVNIFNTHLACQNGNEVDSGITHGSTSRLELLEIHLKGRSFNQTSGSEKGPDGRIVFTGRVPKRGPAHGTIELAEELGTIHEPESEPIDLGHCASGRLTWNASRR